MGACCFWLHPFSSLYFHYIRSSFSPTYLPHKPTANHITMRTPKHAYPSFTLVLSESPGVLCPPSYRSITEEKPRAFWMIPSWHKDELMQTVDYRTHEDLEYSSSFLLPNDIFDDDENENEVDIQDTTSRSEPMQSRRRWRISLSALIAALLLVVRRCRKVLAFTKHVST